MLTLSREKFEDSLVEFEELGNNILKLAKERHKRYREEKKEAEKKYL